MMDYQENHEEAQEELPKKVKYFYSAAVQNWDAEFYVKVDDNVDLDLGNSSSFMSFFLQSYVWSTQDVSVGMINVFDRTEGLIGLLESRRGQDGAYIGCMKSGDVITEEFVYTQLSSVHTIIEHYDL